MLGALCLQGLCWGPGQSIMRCAGKSLCACCCCHDSYDAETACGSSATCVFVCSFVFMNFLACVWYYVATIEGLENSWLTSVGGSTLI